MPHSRSSHIEMFLTNNNSTSKASPKGLIYHAIFIPNAVVKLARYQLLLNTHSLGSARARVMCGGWPTLPPTPATICISLFQRQ